MRAVFFPLITRYFSVLLLFILAVLVDVNGPYKFNKKKNRDGNGEREKKLSEPDDLYSPEKESMEIGPKCPSR